MKLYTATGVCPRPLPYTTHTLHETFTLANGDTLRILCDQVFVITPGMFLGTDTWKVAGGTGQFSHATGSGTGNTTIYLNTNTRSLKC